MSDWQRSSSGSRIQVRDLPAYEDREPERRDRRDDRRQSRPLLPIVGATALAIGVPLWIFGAKWTLEGLILGSNLLLSWLTLPAALPMPTGWWVLLAVIPGALFSIIEVIFRPLARRGDRMQPAPPLFWLIWAVLVVADVGTTYIGYRGEAHQWAFAAQVAAYPVWSGAWALVLTFAPEWLIIGGLRLISR
jgi:hypothetical protein